MASFFEKLKKGMGVETPLEKELAVKKSASSADAPEKRKAKKEPSFAKTSGSKQKPVAEKTPPVETVPQKAKKKVKKIEVKATPASETQEKKEIEKPKLPSLEAESEGELAIDVYQTENDLVIQSAVAGVNPENLDIVMEKDLVTIKGFRKKPADEDGDYFTQECFWGQFKREIILPVEVDPGFAKASMKEGVLVIRLPKILREKKRVIKINP